MHRQLFDDGASLTLPDSAQTPWQTRVATGRPLSLTTTPYYEQSFDERASVINGTSNSLSGKPRNAGRWGEKWRATKICSLEYTSRNDSYLAIEALPVATRGDQRSSDVRSFVEAAIAREINK
jgi:hypothetical protein